MKKEALGEMRAKVFHLTDRERIERDLYLKQFYDGVLHGPLVDDVAVSKPGLANLRSKPLFAFQVEDNPLQILKAKIEKNGIYDKKIIFTMDHRSKTYGQVYTEAQNIAAALKKSGLKRGDTIACIFLNSIDEASALLGALALGVRVKYIDFTKGLGAVKKYMGEADAKAVIMDDMFKAMIPFIYKRHIPFIIADNNKEYSFFNISTLRKFMKSASEEVQITAEKDDPAIVITSSGTTGKPKPIVHSIYSMNCGIRKVMYEDMQLGEGTVIAKVIPSHIAMGVVGILCSALYSETPVVMVRGNSALECAENTIQLVKGFVQFKKEHGLPENTKLTLFSSPVFLKTLADNAESFDDLSCLGTLLSAGSKLGEDVIEYVCEKIQSKGCFSKPVNVYGQNEMHLQTANNERGNKFGSVGTPTIGTNIIVVDDNNEILAPNMEGRVLEQSDSTFVEYQGLQDKTKDSFITLKDGSVWFDTQDKGYIDPDGYVFITGRFSRSMVRFDCKISLELVEEKIKKHTDVKDCVMVALEQKNEEDHIPVLFIDTGSKRISYEKIIKDLKRKGITLSEYEAPEFVEIIKIPYLSSQKPDIYRLTQYAQKKYPDLASKKPKET